MHRAITAVTKPLIIISLALSLTACGAGQTASSRLVKKVTDGQEVTIKDNGVDIRILNLLLVATDSGDAVVVGTILNRGTTEDELIGISVAGTDAVLTGEKVLNPKLPIRFEGDSANAKAVFYGVSPKAGQMVTISLGFARSGLVTTEVLIRDQRDDYKNVVSTPTEVSVSPDSQPPQ